MSQNDVKCWLENQRRLNPDTWYRVKDIKLGLESDGFTNGVIKGVSNDLYKLIRFNDIEWRGVGVWEHHKEFRGLGNI